jgi:HEAT repeat protein
MFSIDTLRRALEAGGITVAVFFLALIVSRFRIEYRTRAARAAENAIEPLLQSWLVYNGDLEPLKKTLRDLPAHAAFRSLAHLATQHVTLHNQRHLALALRPEPWVSKILRRSQSPFWWRRFDAARLLTAVGTEQDADMVARLLGDRSAAVRLVAIDAAARLQGRALVEKELDTLPLRQDAVQIYQIAALSHRPGVVSEVLIERLLPDAPVSSLNSWIDAAGALVDPRALERVRNLATHSDADVRVHVARALRRYADPGTPAVLIQLLGDEDWRVRAQAARALGALRCGEASSQLMKAVHDRSWWVRYRSALALAQIGGPAAEYLLQLTSDDDPMARDMSRLVASLSSAAVVEMSEV